MNNYEIENKNRKFVTNMLDNVVKSNNIFPEIPQAFHGMGQVILTCQLYNSRNLGYHIYVNYPINPTKYYIFKETGNGLQVEYLGSYRYLKHIDWVIRENIFNNGG